jgi:phosphohistidine phosphatase SixA
MFKRKPRPADHQQWTGGQVALAVLLVLLGLGITFPAFIQLYRTAVGLLIPFMGWWAWTVPVCGEIAFAFLFLNGVLLQLRRAPGGGVRALFMALLVVGSVVLQVYAAHGVLPSIVGHVVVVVAFFGVMLSGKATIMSLRGGKIRSDSITLGEWVAHPVHSFRLWRWMKYWGEPSRDAAQDRYMRLLLAIAIAQEDPHVGRGWGWRRKLPVTLRYELATGKLPEAAGDGWAEAIASHVQRQLPSVRAVLAADIRRAAETTVRSTGAEDPPNGTAGQSEGPAQGAVQRPRERTPNFDRRPTAKAAKSMTGEALAPYVTRWVEQGHKPTIGAVAEAFHIGEIKAKLALKTAGLWGADAPVIALGAAATRP